jgi:YD repeat-containing protein
MNVMATDDRTLHPLASGDMYSTAFQFYSHINADVDPRTGMYSASVDLTTGEGNRLRGPHLPFRLSYNALDSIDEGFGRGWRLSLTEFDVATSLLTLSSGDSHKITGYLVGQPAQFPDRLLDSCSLTKLDALGREAVVEHITGVVEHLEVPSSSQDLLRPVRIVNPSGDAIQIEWESAAGNPRLMRVLDNDGEVLLSVDYNTSTVVLTLNLGNADSLQLHFQRDGDVLESISIPLIASLNHTLTAKADEAVWKFSYSSGDVMLLESVTSPGGIVDSVLYDMEAMELPSGAPQQYMPAVSERTRRSASSSRLIQKSKYSYKNFNKNNFYGFPDVRTWEDRHDQLLHLVGADAFSYGSTEEQYDADDVVLCTIERTYNHFHLITGERTTRGHVVQDIVTDYGIKESTPFEDQAVSFQLPHKVTTTSYDTRSEDIKQVTFTESSYDGDNDDDPYKDGNIRSRYDSATDTTEESTYYPPEGETDADGIVLCPPDPMLKVRRLKSRKTTPGNKGGPVRSTHYRYTQVPVRDPAKDIVRVTATIVERALGKLLSRRVARSVATIVATCLAEAAKYDLARFIGRRRLRDRTYYVQASAEISTVWEGSIETVLVQSGQTFVLDQGDQHGSLSVETREQNGLKETRRFSYETDDDVGTVTTTTEHTTYDGVVNTTSETLYLVSGLVHSTVDALGNKAEFTYDALGRRTSEVLSPDHADYRVETHWNYQLSMSERWVERIGITGLPHRVWMDEQGRTIRREEPLPDKSLMTVHELEYDGFGQLVREVQSDSLRDGTPLHLETTYAYDDWGRCKLMTSPDKSQTVSETTLIRNAELYGDEVITRTVQWQVYGPNDERTGWRSTDLDAADQQRRAEAGTWSAEGEQVAEATTSWEYDGVGRCVLMKDPLDQVTKQAWDEYDRLTRTDLPDGTAVLRTYAPGHEDEFVTRLAVIPPATEESFWRGALKAGQLVLGTRTWDGLGRLKTERAGSLLTSYDYKEKQMSAAKKTMPNRDWLQMEYEVRLREVLIGSTLMNANGTVAATLTSATYDNQLGLPTEIIAEGGMMTITPDYLGRMTHQTIALNGDRERTCDVIVTPGGLVLEKTGTDGVQQIYDYDEMGRLKSVIDHDVEISLVYDELSRLSSRTARSVIDGRSISQGMTYDALGRVSEQTWLHADASTPTPTKRRLVFDWRKDDKVSERHWYGEDDTPALRDETMKYDKRGRLISHAIVAVDGEYPADEIGKPYVEQVFTPDCLDNLRAVKTTRLDGAVNDTSYSYDIGGKLPNFDRLIEVRNSHPDYPGFANPLTLIYDDNGNLIDDGQQRKLYWDGAGRLSTVTLADGKQITYTHGPDGRVSSVTREQVSTYRYREDGAIAFEFDTNEGRRFIRAEGGIVAETRLAGAIRETFLLGTDPQGSVVTESNPGKKS